MFMNLCQNWLGNSTVPHGLDLNSLIGYSSRSLGRNFPLMSSTLADTQKDGLSWETPRTPIQGLPMSPLKQGGQTACQWPQHPQRIFPKEVELLVFRSESINCVHHFCLTVLVKGAVESAQIQGEGAQISCLWEECQRIWGHLPY